MKQNKEIKSQLIDLFTCLVLFAVVDVVAAVVWG